MNGFESISTELLYKFNDIKYYDEPHKYYVRKKNLISVTTLLHKYKEKFDEKYWSNIKAKQYGITDDEVIRCWRFINKKGTMKGSIIHDYCENLFLNKVFEYPKIKILNEFGFDPIINEYNTTKKYVDNFVNDTYNKLIPIKTELVIYDLEYLIAGMLDILFYNVKARELQIWDYKTNKKFTKESKRKLSGILSILGDDDLTMYSLQLSMYKYIIEKNTDIKLGTSYLVWFSHNNSNYKVIETKDYEYYAKKIFEDSLN